MVLPSCDKIISKLASNDHTNRHFVSEKPFLKRASGIVSIYNIIFTTLIKSKYMNK